MLLDTSFYGFKKSIVTFIKVILWVGASGFVAALVAYFSNYAVDTANLYQVGALALVNATLASVWKWLSSVDPNKVNKPVEV